MGLALGGCPWTPDPCLPPQGFPMGTPRLLEVEGKECVLGPPGRPRPRAPTGASCSHPCPRGAARGGTGELEVPGWWGCWWWCKQDRPELLSWHSSSQSRAQPWGCLARGPLRRSCVSWRVRGRSATWGHLLMKSTTTPVQVRSCDRQFGGGSLHPASLLHPPQH